jgi:hypothetical protein
VLSTVYTPIGEHYSKRRKKQDSESYRHQATVIT